MISKRIVLLKPLKKSILLFIIFFILSAENKSFAFQKELPELEVWTMVDMDKAITYCESKTRATLNRLNTYEKLPRTIPTNETHWKAQPVGDWTSGFWVGILWYIYDATEDEKIKAWRTWQIHMLMC